MSLEVVEGRSKDDTIIKESSTTSNNSIITTPKTNLKFDFRVTERPIYKPNSGPPLQPISLIPAHDKKGIILDCIPYPEAGGPNYFIVGYKEEPTTRLLVHPKNIENYVSKYVLELWEYKRSSEEEDRLVAEWQPAILASERRRKIYKLKKEGESRDTITGLKRKRDESPDQQPKKRGRPRKSMVDVFRPPPPVPPVPPGTKRARGRPRKILPPTLAHTSPRKILQLSQPSLSQPSLSQPGKSGAYSESDDDEDGDEEEDEEEDDGEDDDGNDDVALNRQLNKESNRRSVSATNSSPSTRPRLISPQVGLQDHGTGGISPQPPLKQSQAGKSSHHQPQPAPILPGSTAEGYSSKISVPNAAPISAEKTTVPAASTIRSRYSTILNGKSSTESEPSKRNVHPKQQYQSKLVVESDNGTKMLAQKIAATSSRDQAASMSKRNLFSSTNKSPRLPRASAHNRSLLLESGTNETNEEHTGALSSRHGSIANGQGKHNGHSPGSQTQENTLRRSSRSQSRRLESDKDGEDITQEDADELVPYDSGSVWEVRSILSHEYRWDDEDRKKDKKLWYLIDWVGKWDPSWEPAENVLQPLIDEYNGQRGQKANGGQAKKLKGVGAKIQDEAALGDGPDQGSVSSDPDSLFVSERKVRETQLRENKVRAKQTLYEKLKDGEDDDVDDLQALEGREQRILGETSRSAGKLFAKHN